MKNRSVIEIMVLTFTFVIAVSVVSLGVSITVLEIQSPGVDTRGASTALFNLLSGMTGALVGLLAAKAEGRSSEELDLPKLPDPPNDPPVS